MKLHGYEPKQTRQVEKINRVINTTIQIGFDWKHELDTFLLSYKKMPHKRDKKETNILLKNFALETKESRKNSSQTKN